MPDIFSAGALGCVYALVAFVSFLFAVMSLIGTEFGDVLDIDADADVDTGVDFASVSPFALAVFGATFGLVGLITLIWFELNAIPSILISTVSGLIVGGLAQALFLYVLSPSKSSHFSLEKDAVGREANVTVSIPEDGQGQIAYNNVSGRVKVGARSATGDAIPSGQIVVIERIVGRAALVRPVDEQQ